MRVREHAVGGGVQRSCESALSLFLGQSPFCRLLTKTGKVVVSAANHRRRCVFALITYACVDFVEVTGHVWRKGLTANIDMRSGLERKMEV